VTGDGQRFLYAIPKPIEGENHFRIVTNWTQLLTRQ
jgi:hypothetical protein